MRRNTLTFHLIVLFILLKAEAARTVRFNNSRLLSLAKTRRPLRRAAHKWNQRSARFDSLCTCEAFDYEIDPDTYPQARRNEFSDNFFCKYNVSDPYRWMENPDLPETKQFVSQVNAISRSFFERAPSRQLFRQKVLYRKKKLDDEEEEPFLDPNVLFRNSSKALLQTAFSEDGRLVAFVVSEKGSDLSAIKFMDHTGNVLKDEIPRVKYTSVSWTPNNDGIFYSKFASRKKAYREAVIEMDQYHSLFYHKLGTNYTEDVLVADFREWGVPNLWITGSLLGDGRFLFVYVYNKDTPNSVFFCDLSTVDYRITERLNLTMIFYDSKAFFRVVDYNPITKHALVMTNHGSPTHKLIRVSVETAMKGPLYWKTLIKAHPNRTLNSVTVAADDKLLLQYIEDVKSTMYVYDAPNVYKIPLGVGSVRLCYASKKETEAFFLFITFVEPPKTYRIDFSQMKRNVVRVKEIRRRSAVAPEIDTADFVVKQEFYESRDGTKIPIFLMHRANLKLNGRNPTILHGYGGFNTPQLPSYSSLQNLFVKHFAGVVAFASIRGGGEYGDVWHKRGSREHKQNSFDDFIAAAEYLITKKYTSPSRLAIKGNSNGGLLVAVCAQQRPELFGAVVSQVGIMDMLRFHKFTAGSSWIVEYGNPDVCHEFEYIYKYSPLHNIWRLARSQQWPSTLMMTADHDDRVVPLHTLKYAAELYHVVGGYPHRLVQRNPLLVRVELNAGHGPGKSLSKLIDEAVDEMSFLQRTLRLKWHDDEGSF